MSRPFPYTLTPGSEEGYAREQGNFDDLNLNPLQFRHASAASAAALALPDGADIVTVTGTTTITSIVAGAPRRVTLIFADVLTVTDGSNLRLAGNFVTSADDTLSLVANGVDWFETARAVN